MPTRTQIESIQIQSTTVTPGSYTLANFTVNAEGQLTAASSTTATGTGSVVLAASPTLTGTPLAPTATVGTNTTQVATTAFTTTAVATETTRATTAEALLAPKASPTFTGTANFATIASGAWNGTAIGANYGGTGQTTYSVGDLLYASTTTALSPIHVGTNGQVLTLASGLPTWAAAASGTITSIVAGTGLSGGTIATTGTVALANTTVTAGSYTIGAFTVNAQGQLTAASSTTTTGTGNVVLATSPVMVTPTLGAATATSINGLTVATSTGNLTIANGSTLATSGAYGITLTALAASNVTIPTTGTLATTAVTSLPSLTSVGTVTTGTWDATTIAGTYGGTGVNNGAHTMTYGGNVAFTGAYASNFTLTAATSLTLPTAGTLLTTSAIPSSTSGYVLTATGTAGVAGATSPSALSVLATNSTTARTLATRAADRINVLDWGFDPTGTSDNGPVLAGLVSSLPSTPVTVYFPAVGAATYKFNSASAFPDTVTAVFDSGVTFTGLVGLDVITDEEPMIGGSAGQTIGRIAQRGGNAYAQYISFSIVNNESTVSSEKAAIYINTIQAETSEFGTYTKDGVGINSSIQPASGNTASSITACYFRAFVPSGTDGVVSAAEFNLQNNAATAQSNYGTTTSKVNVNLTNGGGTENTAAICVESGSPGWYDGITVQSGAVSRNAFSILNFSANTTPFAVDANGNLIAQSGTFAALSVPNVVTAGSFDTVGNVTAGSVNGGNVQLSSDANGGVNIGIIGSGTPYVSFIGNNLTSGYSVRIEADTSGHLAFTNNTGGGANVSLGAVVATGALTVNYNGAPPAIAGPSNGGCGLGFGWNVSGGYAECDFVAYRESGQTGGFAWYDYIVGGSPVPIATLSSTGVLTVGTTNVNGNLNVTGTGYVAKRSQTPTYSSSLSVSWAAADITNITLTGNITITNTGAVDGQTLTLYITQGTGGSHTVSWGTGTVFNASLSSITLSTTVGAVDMIGLVYRASTGKYNIIAFAQGIS